MGHAERGTVPLAAMERSRSNSRKGSNLVTNIGRSLSPGQGPWPGEPTSGSYICRRIMRGTAITMSTAMVTRPMRTMGGSLR